MVGIWLSTGHSTDNSNSDRRRCLAEIQQGTVMWTLAKDLTQGPNLGTCA